MTVVQHSGFVLLWAELTWLVRMGPLCCYTLCCLEYAHACRSCAKCDHDRLRDAPVRLQDYELLVATESLTTSMEGLAGHAGAASLSRLKCYADGHACHESHRRL